MAPFGQTVHFIDNRIGNIELLVNFAKKLSEGFYLEPLGRDVNEEVFTI